MWSLQRAVYRPRGASPGRREAADGRRWRPVPRVLEPGVHAVRPAIRRFAEAACPQEHRHWTGPRAHDEYHRGYRHRLRDGRFPAHHPDSGGPVTPGTVSYTHLRAHETRHELVCRLLLDK